VYTGARQDYLKIVGELLLLVYCFQSVKGAGSGVEPVMMEL